MTAMRSERLGTDKADSDRSGPEPSAPERRAPDKLNEIDKVVTAFEGEIREFVRRDGSLTRRARNDVEPKPETVSDSLNALIGRVSVASMEEIDRVIAELQSVREMLRHEGDRVSREIAGYASLNHAAMTAMKVIGDSLIQWRGNPPNHQQRPPN